MNMKNTKRMRTFFLGALVLSISAWIGGRQYYLKLNEKEQEALKKSAGALKKVLADLDI